VKIVRKIMTFLVCVAVLFASMMIPATNAEAAGAKTFTVHYDGSGWYFQTNEDSRWLGMDSIASYFNAGDSIVVDGLGVSGLPTCNITINVAIGDACSAGGATTIINASAGVARAYASYEGTLVINGNADTVLASGQGVVQVNGNVNVLSADYTSGNARYGISGTVNKATAKINSETVDTYYSIVAGKMTPDANGIVWLNAGEFSKTPGATTPATAPANNNNNNELDDVPKTGSFAFEIAIVLIAVAAMFGTASVVVFRKKAM